MSQTIAQYIDHTLLKTDATEKMIQKLIQEAKEYQFASVCINPCWVGYCQKHLQNDPVQICTVIGFPLGATTSSVKRYEAIEALEKGATELDVVMNIGHLKAKNHKKVLEDLKGVVEEAKNLASVKVIIETALLTLEEKILACELVKEAGAQFIKTSTGFSNTGATLEDVRLLYSKVQGELKVKASGGIRTLKDVKAFIDAGASRIGTSSGINIIRENAEN